MRIIPAIDLKDGKCVRLLKGDFDRTTEYSNDPLSISRRFSALDVQDLHVVDLDGARSGQLSHRSIVQAIAAETGLEVQLGGGIRDRAAIADWFDHGVTRCVTGSMAITNVPVVTEWLRDFGSERLVLALDVNIADDGVPMLTTHGWTRESGVSLWESLDHYSAEGVRHVLCTDVSRDGAMAGPNVQLYREVLRRYPDLQLQASGGVRDIDDLRRLRAERIPAAISGRALLDGAITAQEVATFRRNA